ncbi:MAG: hypothetical protein ACREHD_03515 [Pirellulales bacterium]
MSELAARGFRVTIPEVDVGRDVLAFLETQPEVTSLQVKSTECKRLKVPGNFRGQITVPLLQLTLGGNLYYAFAFDLEGKWLDYLIVGRETLNGLRLNEGIGSTFTTGNKQYVKFWFRFTAAGKKAGVRCGDVAFDEYRNAWQTLPVTPDVDGHGAAAQAIHGVAQTAVMSALLRMGCNVAAVEIDKLLAFQDDEPGFTHLRVKGSEVVPALQQGVFTAEVDLPLAELKSPSQLYYVLAFQTGGRCSDFVVISRSRLNELRLSEDLGVEHEDNTGTQVLTLTFELSSDALSCGLQPFDDYRNAWTSLPPLALHQA